MASKAAQQMKTPPKPVSFGPLVASALVLSTLLAISPRIRAQGASVGPYTFTTLAGAPGQEGNANGTGNSARLSLLGGIVSDASGNLYVSDTSNSRIQKISSAGVVTTLTDQPSVTDFLSKSGSGNSVYFSPSALAVDSSGTVYTIIGNQIWKISSSGVPTLLAGSGMQGTKDGQGDQAQFAFPAGIAVDKAGNVYVAGDSTVRMISPNGTVMTIAGAPSTMGAVDGTGGAARFSGPTAIAIDAAGNLYIGDAGNSFTVRKMTSAGVVTTLAGNAGSFGTLDGTGSAAHFGYPNAIAVDANGNVFVTQADNVIRQITSAGVVTTIAGTPGVSGSSDGTGSKALFNDPIGIAVDPSGNLVVADSKNFTVRKQYVSPNAAPSILSQPADQSVAIGAAATFSVSAAGIPAPAYQWTLNGNAIRGAVNATLAVANVQATDLGTYAAVVTNSSGSIGSAAATLSSPGVAPVTAAPAASRLANISSRALVGTGSNAMIAGFVISGPGGSTDQVMIRGVGPSLFMYGITNPLNQPVLTLFDSTGAQIATNTVWGFNSNFWDIVGAEPSSGAFALAYNSNDSVLLTNLAPGTYTAQVSGAGGTSGIALAEVYEVSSTGAHISNISTRAFVGTGSSVEIAGIGISGTLPQKVLVRAVGPTLSKYGVTGPLAQPSLALVDSSGNQVAANTGWSTASNAAAIAAAAASVGAFPLPAGSADGSLLVTLQPGTYSAVASGVGSSTGTALVEVYQVP